MLALKLEPLLCVPNPRESESTVLTEVECWHPLATANGSALRANVIRPRTLRIVALVVALMVCLAAFAGWDTVFERYVTSDWLSQLTIF